MAASQANPLQLLVEDDPYVSLGRLGEGSYGYVDKVEKRENSGTVFARKTVRISGRNRELSLRTANNEARILRRLQHRHIVSVLELYTHRNKLHIIMSQVADGNLLEYLELVDGETEGRQRDALRTRLQIWPGCLVRAIDYLHEMRVKHKDLKPENILIKGDQVFIADFGISKDLIDEETSATQSEGPRGTPMYWAPEVNANSRRGRAVDIFSLGCVFLEIATAIMAPPCSLERFSKFRDKEGSRRYSRCPVELIQWIWYLWGIWDQYGNRKKRKKANYDDFLEHGAAVYDLAFLMLDPDSKKRVTSRQLVAMIHAQTLYYCNSVKGKACAECSRGPIFEDSNLPLHSVYKDTDDLDHPKSPEHALTVEASQYFAGLGWEGVKGIWLEKHMWWDTT